MNKPILRAALASGAACLLLVALSSGCSTDRNPGPLSPTLETAPNAQNPVPGGMVISEQGLNAPEFGFAPIGTKTVKRAIRFIDGSKGGTVTCGRVMVTFSPGAFSGWQSITVVDMSTKYVSCQLYPEGLKFAAPVTLKFGLAGTTGTGGKDCTIYWYNPTDMSWVDIRGSYKESDDAIEAPLEHFSSYAPGRAGW